MPAKQEDKTIAAQILCAFLDHPSVASELLGINRSKAGDLEAVWSRICDMVSKKSIPPAMASGS